MELYDRYQDALERFKPQFGNLKHIKALALISELKRKRKKVDDKEATKMREKVIELIK